MSEGGRERKDISDLKIRKERREEGSSERKWREYGGDSMVDEKSIRSKEGEGMVGGIRCGMGCRKLIYSI